MMLFLFFDFIISIRNIAVCFDKGVICTRDEFPNLPKKTIFYPFIKHSLSIALLTQCLEETAAYAIFSENADFIIDMSMIMTVSLKELHFMTENDDIMINFSFSSMCSFNTLNVTKLTLNILSELYMAYNSMVYYFDNGSIINPHLISIYCLDRMIPYVDFNKTKKLNFYTTSNFNLMINYDSLENEFIEIVFKLDQNKILLADKVVEYSDFAYLDNNLIFNFFLSKQSKSIKFILGYVENVQVSALSSYKFQFFSTVDGIGSESEVNIDIVTEQDWVDKSFGFIPIFYFKEMFPFIHLNTNIQTQTFSIAFYDYSGIIIYNYPIVLQMYLFFDNIPFDSLCYDGILVCFHVNENIDANMDNIFLQYRYVNALSIIFSSYLQINLSALTINGYYTFQITGTDINKSIINVTDCQESNTDWLLFDCSIIFPIKTIEIPNIPYLANAQILNPEVLHIVEIFCNYDDLSSCIDIDCEVAQIFYPLTTAIEFVFYDDKVIAYGVEVKFGKNNPIKAKTLHLTFDLGNFYGNSINIKLDSTATNIPPVFITPLNSYMQYKINFVLSSFEKELNRPFEVTFQTLYILSGNLRIGEVPKNVIIKAIDLSNENILYDMSPINVSTFSICYPGTICNEYSTVDYLFYFQDYFKGDFEMKEIKNRLDNSRNSQTFENLLIVYSTLYYIQPISFDIFDTLNLDLFYNNLIFKGDNIMMFPSIVINSIKQFNAKSLTINNARLSISAIWHIPILRLINNGVLNSANTISAGYLEIDSINIYCLNSINCNEILINIALYNYPLDINIGGQYLSIGLAGTSNIPQNGKVTLKFSQNQYYDDLLLLSFYSLPNSSPPNIIFDFTSIRSFLLLNFSDGWDSNTNSPKYKIIVNDSKLIDIQGMQKNIQIEYVDQKDNIIYQFPTYLNNEISFCCSNYHQMNDYCYNVSKTIGLSFVKLIRDENEISNILKNTDFMMLNSMFIYIDQISYFNIDLQNLLLNPKELYISGNQIENNSLNIDLNMENEANRIQRLQIFNSNVSLGRSLIKIESIDLNNGKLDANIDSNTLKACIDDIENIKGNVKSLTLNYSNPFANETMNICFTKDGLLVDLIHVNIEGINALNIVYELIFNKTTTIVYSFQETPKIKEYNFRLLFTDQKAGYIDKRSIAIKFDESWNDNYMLLDDGSGNENITINLTQKGLQQVYYYPQDTPNRVNLWIDKGTILYKITSSIELTNNSTNSNHLVVFLSSCGLLFVIVFFGCFSILKLRRKIILYQNNHIIP
ncbi:hypothetical protein TRFO_20024 [Tritrichomonas foetus]|uniref:Uncharacterized protein n=1 Tax=Tritrichomonas foetus TaxID=1144522 RepID=A0A1J4KGT3_9EUKA|nr:hypothetical protein TRFO_20024 [Tritrichomonas foetus]|eukprot:OHT10615.1 hypothetical protein TRFO_20024 [Tritrichomonas foetus]